MEQYLHQRNNKMKNINDGKVEISGIAVREGISKNGRRYISKELSKFAPTLIGRPIMKDHSGTTDSVIGKVTQTEIIDSGKIITYKGWVKGEDIIEKIRDGRISEVSIGAFSRRIVRDKDNENIVIPVDMEAMELSVTPVPGVVGTSIQPEESTKPVIDSVNYAVKHTIINDFEQININHNTAIKSRELNKNKEKYNSMVDYKLIAELQAQIEALKKKENKVSNNEDVTNDSAEGYVIEQSESGRGYSFFKWY